MTGRPLVDALLPGWMNGQRWFGGKGREIRATRTMVAPIDTGDFTDEPPVWLHLVTVVYADGVEHQYFVPLSVHESADDSLDHAFLGVAPTDDGKQAYVYDALRDRGATTFWSRLFASGGEGRCASWPSRTTPFPQAFQATCWEPSRAIPPWCTATPRS